MACGDIKVPDSLYQLGHGKPGITLFKALAILKLKDQFEVLRFHAVVQEAVVADLLEATGKHMQKIAPDEFRAVQGDTAFRVAGLFASGGKGNLILREVKDAAVGDGDPVGIAAQIFNGITEAVKGLLDVRTPVFFVKPVLPLIPGGGITQLFAGRGKNKVSVFVKGRELSHKFPLELIPENFNRDKKPAGGFADLMFLSKPAAGDDTVHMHMVEKLLVPGMENLDNAGLSAEVLFIGGQFQKGLCTG